MSIPRNTYAKIVLFCFALAAVMYNSWPLGYLLDEKTARFDLASDLSMSGHPYDWLFMGMDIFVGVSLIAVIVILQIELGFNKWSKTWSMLLIGVLVFGLFTATGAGATNNCNVVVLHRVHLCTRLDHQTLGMDYLESTLAATGMLVGLVGANLHIRRLKLSSKMKQINLVALLGYALSGIYFIYVTLMNQNQHFAQQILLVFFGIALLVIGIDIYSYIVNSEDLTTDVPARILE